MSFKFFLIPVQASQPVEDEMNAFVRSHKVLAVNRQLVDAGSSSFWTFCVEYVDGQLPASVEPGRAASRGEVDYRKVLSEADFAVYATLRELRKELAQADGVPPYQVFNNRQLAEMVQKKMRTKSDLRSLPTVGEARIEKYGDRFLTDLIKIWDGQHETDSKPV